jgi:hypothetical protein
MNGNKIIFNIAIPLFIILATPIIAQNQNRNNPDRRPQVSDTKCITIQSKISEMSKRYDNNKKGFVERYNNAQKRLSELVVKLNERGYDTVKLQADLKIWEEKINKIGIEHNEFLTALQSAKEKGCGTDNKVFKEALQFSRVQLSDVKSSAKEAKDFYQSVIREDLKKIKEQQVLN